MSAIRKTVKPLFESLYDVDFLEDMLNVFPNASGYAPKAGSCGKYIYTGNNWAPVIEHNPNYYPSKADHDLVITALREVGEWGLPEKTPYIDLGAGGQASFRRYALPVLKQLNSMDYTGVDFCDNVLHGIQALQPEFLHSINIQTTKLDLFFPTNKILSKDRPALGVMNGLTIGNIGNAKTSDEVNYTLAASLKYLSQLCGNGWLLLTTDPNQNESSLMKAYDTPLGRSLFLSLLKRMSHELPVESFDPSLFNYKPIFNRHLQRIEHVVIATATQDFMLGSHPIHVEKGQNIHLLSSYKYRRDFFESCCEQANLKPVKSWQHESGVMMYLLRDNLCPVPQNVPPIRYAPVKSELVPG